MKAAESIKVLVISGWITCGLVFVAVGSASRVSASEGSKIPLASNHKKVGSAPCKDCHADLIKEKNVHAPAAEACDTCHEYNEAGTGATVKLAMEGNTLCFTCHTEKQEDLATKKSKHPPAEDNCTNCHNPHSTEAPRLLKAAAPDLCYICHTEMEEAVKTKKFVHRPVRELGCVVCHNPHATDVAPLLRKEPPGLCLTCHDKKLTYKKNEAGQIVIFADTRIPGDFPDKAIKIALDSTDKGHPYMAHPVGGIPDPSRPNKNLSCVSCHNPHAGNVPRMFRDDAKRKDLCLRCHK